VDKDKLLSSGWKKKFKGSKERGGAYIYTHPKLERAIVVNHNGISFNGKYYSTLEDAKRTAELSIENC
jgi:hypothetical protein